MSEESKNGSDTAGIVGSSALFCWVTVTREIKSYIWAHTRGKARAATMRCAQDAGYQVGMIDVRCRRAHEYDSLKFDNGRRNPAPYCCYSEEFLLEQNQGDQERP